MVRLLGTDPGPVTPPPPPPLSPPPSSIRDVTGEVTVLGGRIRRTRRPGRYRQTVTLVNAGTGAVAGPLYLVLDGLRRRVRLRGANALTQGNFPLGSPCRVLISGGDNVLSPGETLTVTLEFSSPALRRISYTPRVLAGVGLP